MTWKDFSIIVMGYEKKELSNWARTRNLAYIIYLSNCADSSPKSIKSFWPMADLDNDGETDEEKDLISDEQLARTLKLYGVN
jgi:hypothetical protein